MSIRRGGRGVALHVSLPHRLWQQAQEALPGRTDSAIVREALEQLVARRRKALDALGASPDGALVRFEDALSAGREPVHGR